MELNSADTVFLDKLAASLPEGRLAAVEPRYLEEPRGRLQGRGAAIAKPRSVEEVATIVKACAEARIGLVPYGGGTGVVGGQVMGAGPLPLILSLEHMRAIRGIYPSENVITVEAGVVLAEIQQNAEQAGRLFPLSLASEGSCQIGGNLASNAGGVNVLRYGNARDLCLGLEAVLPNGDIWNGLTRLRKDNTGFDLRNLLIGSEGSLGVITAASLKLFAPPVSQGTALLSVPNIAAALEILSLARGLVGEAVSAFEVMHWQGMEILAEQMPEVRRPIEAPTEWLVLVDLGLGAGVVAQDVLLELFELAAGQDLVSDGVIAQSETQRNEIWTLRESIPLANRKVGSVLSNDISVPLSHIEAFVRDAARDIAALGPFRINAFGHLGDGNLHFNIFPPKGENRSDYNGYIDDLKEIIYRHLSQYQGSFSAEHGIGRIKVDTLERFGDPTRLAAMRAIKQALDPFGIMNPGAVLAREA